MGYKFTKNGEIEDQQEYLKRISGLQRLYSAVLITKSKRAQQHLEHPYGIENAWMWLSNYLMLDPLPGISEVLVLEFIQICGAEMWQVYKRQFMKLLVVLHAQYIPRLERVNSSEFWFSSRHTQIHENLFYQISVDGQYAD